MAEPLTLGAAVFLSSAVSEALHRGVDVMIKKPEWDARRIDMIGDKLDALIEGPFRAAQLALKRGDVNLAIAKLEEGLGNDPFNARGWVFYATLLAKQDNELAKKRSVEIFADIIKWFGLECPALPNEIREEYAPHDLVQVPSNDSVVKTLNALDSSWLHCSCVGVSQAGLAASFYQKTPLYFFNLKVAINVYFIPWQEPPKTLSFFPDIATLDSNVYSKGNTYDSITGMTDRFVVMHERVWDIENRKSVRLGAEKISATFGYKKYGWGAATDAVIRGVTVKFGSDIIKKVLSTPPRGGTSYYRVFARPKVTAIPPIIAPESVLTR